MEQHEAIALIRPGVPRPGGTWADLGAGAGVFSRALATLLGPAGTVYAVDRDARALRELARSPARDAASAEIRTLVGDFTQPLDLPPLDGVLLANALHYVPYAAQPGVVRDVMDRLAPGATMIVVEYERRGPNRWVPYPVSFAALGTLARDAGTGAPVRLGSQPSRYGGALYAASLGTSGAVGRH